MVLPSDVSTLVCHSCEGHLSPGVGIMLDDGTSRCGRCIEKLANSMVFSCRYKDDGCQQTVKCEENQKHEQVCAFRPLVCPITETAQCKWFGKSGDFLQHCRACHPRNVKQDSFKFEYNIKQSNLHYYIVSAFQVLFLIQIKVCLTSKNIYHSVFLLGDSKTATKYKFNLDIERNSEKIIKLGMVVPRECLSLQQDTAVTISIDSLLNVLGHIEGCKCTLTLRSTEAIQIVRAQVTCVMCKLKTYPVATPSPQFWLCGDCATLKRTCRYHCKGCTYTDIADKCTKHEQYFCKFNNKCPICQKDINSGLFDVHYMQAHLNITYGDKTEFSVTLATKEQFFIISTDFGNVICKYFMDNANFVLYICTPLPYEQLYRYQCVMELSQLTKRCTHILNAQYNDWHCDWRMNIPYSAYKSFVCESQCNLKIYFTKIIP